MLFLNKQKKKANVNLLVFVEGGNQTLNHSYHLLVNSSNPISQSTKKPVIADIIITISSYFCESKSFKGPNL
jgi:hypothetical protein